jgi:hypothetical protein
MPEPYRQRSPETWRTARAFYLDGATAEEVCDRFHLGLSALRKRARVEGWRRADQDDPEAETGADDDQDLPEMDDPDFLALAWRQMGIEARRGRVKRALAWARLREMVLRQMDRQARLRRRLDREAPRDRPDAPGPIRAATPSQPSPARAPGLARLHEVQEVHPICAFPDLTPNAWPPGPPPPPPIALEVRARGSPGPPQDLHRHA